MDGSLSLGSAGLALLFGILSFISPCVLPLVPAYLSYISGHTFEELTGKKHRGQIITTTLLQSAVFCLGFTVVFLAMGVTATKLGSFLQTHKMLFNQIAGIVLIIFGLHMVGAFRIKFLLMERRFEGKKGRWGIIGTFVVGIAFAFGWTPCIGPFLAGLLFLASNQNTVGQGFFLLLVYSLGLAIPFLLAAVAVNTFLSAFQKVKRHFRTIEVVGGILLIEFGHIIFFNKLGWLAAKLGFVDLGF
ncbi:MAG TPA: cytochrome c biogenesis CcdA family protein [bacterium]|nr:cytochrome c biogenesis CcdA family protein [bacterium]